MKNSNLFNDDNVDVKDETVDAEVSHYYAKLKKRIVDLFESGEHQKAIDMLQEELDQPYIPLEYEAIFKDLYSIYTLTVRENQRKIDFESCPKTEIYNQILNMKTGAINTYFLNIYLEFLTTKQKVDINSSQNLILDEEDTTFFQFVLNHPYIINLEKYNFLLELRNFNIDYEFKYFNQNFIELSNANAFIVNPKTMVIAEKQPNIVEIGRFFENRDAKQPDILKYELDFLFILFIALFPKIDIQNNETIIQAITNYVTAIVENTNYDEENIIINLIENEIKKINSSNDNYYF